MRQDPSGRGKWKVGEGQEFQVWWLALGKGLDSEACLRAEQLWIPWLVLLENETDIRATGVAAEVAWRPSFTWGNGAPTTGFGIFE